MGIDVSAVGAAVNMRSAAADTKSMPADLTARLRVSAFGEPWQVVEFGRLADCAVCGTDIEHGDVCMRVLSRPAGTADWLSTGEFVHEDCPDGHDIVDVAGVKPAVVRVITQAWFVCWSCGCCDVQLSIDDLAEVCLTHHRERIAKPELLKAAPGVSLELGYQPPPMQP